LLLFKTPLTGGFSRAEGAMNAKTPRRKVVLRNFLEPLRLRGFICASAYACGFGGLVETLRSFSEGGSRNEPFGAP
jgi:hypothetical protein